MWDWVIDHPEVLAAASTVLLAIFAAVQIGLAIWQSRQTAEAARVEVQGPAWLARRTLEQTLVAARGTKDVLQWAQHAGVRDGLDRMEKQMLEVVRLGGIVKGRSARAAEAAFESFLAYADRVNSLAAPTFSGADGAGGRYATAEDSARFVTAAREALEHLRSSVDQLSKLAPRGKHEAPLSRLDEVRFLREADGAVSSR